MTTTPRVIRYRFRVRAVTRDREGGPLYRTVGPYFRTFAEARAAWGGRKVIEKHAVEFVDGKAIGVGRVVVDRRTHDRDGLLRILPATAGQALTEGQRQVVAETRYQGDPDAVIDRFADPDEAGSLYEASGLWGER